MTKSEVLNILYAERERIEKTYTQPGWTVWAILAAIASLAWLLWEYGEKCNDWSYAALVFGLIYVASIAISACLYLFVSYLKIPIWRKGYIKDYTAAVANTILMTALLIIQLCVIPHSFHPILYWTAVCCEILFVVLFALTLIQIFKGYVQTSKNAKWSFYLCLPIIPIIALFAMYLNGLEYNSIAAKCGVLIYAIHILLNLIPSGEKRQLDQIDGLISKVLYECEDVNERAVIRELELYVVGLRYGRYLSETQLKSYMKQIAQLFNCTKRLIAEIDGGDERQIEAIVAEGDEIYTKLSKTSLSILTKIQLTYGEDNVDNSLTPVLQVGNIGVAIMRYWIRLGEIQKADMPNKKEEIDKAYKETVGSEKIQRMIDDDTMWEAMVK